MFKQIIQYDHTFSHWFCRSCRNNHPTDHANNCASICETLAIHLAAFAYWQATYENTYQLDPVKTYTPDKVKAMIEETLEDYLHGNIIIKLGHFMVIYFAM